MPKVLGSSVAAQSVAEQEMEMTEEDHMSTYDRVVELINQASLMLNDKDKIANLLKVQELIVNKEPTLLDNFLDEMLAFQGDRSSEVKKFVIGFMEESCKRDPEILAKVVPNLNLLLHEDNVAVQKKALLCLPHLITVALMWIAQAKNVTDDMQQIWEALNQMKNLAMEMLESENDGIRTHAVKCMEIVIITLSEKTPESDIPKKQRLAFTIDHLPAKHEFLRFKKLSQNGQKTVDQLLHFQASAHISSINLMTVMSSLTNVAKQRPQFYSKVIQAFETLQVNLPPTLAKSQVSSVRKNLKIQMLQLLKHQSSIDHVSRITTLLTDLGATQSEISKAVPKYEESRKRKAVTDSADASIKKTKVEEADLEIDEDEIGMTPWAQKENRPSAKLRSTAIDITAEDIRDKLTPENVADLVLISMVMLPDSQPAQFTSTYTPIAAAGTDEQIKHLARLLATQLTMAGMGKGIADVVNSTKTTSGGTSPSYDEGGSSPQELSIQVVGQGTHMSASKNVKGVTLDIFKKPDLPIGQGTGRRGIKQFRLATVTKPLGRDEADMMVVAAFNRIVDAEKSKIAGKAMTARTKLLTTLVAHCGAVLKTCLQEYIFDDLKAHSELAFSWLYQEYANGQGYNTTVPSDKNTMASYDDCLTRLLSGLLDHPDHRETLFSRLIMEAPVITNNALQILKRFSQDEAAVGIGMQLIRELIVKRPNHRRAYIKIMLELSTNENAEIRAVALDGIKAVYSESDLAPVIEEFALAYVRFLIQPKPPALLFTNSKIKSELWVDDLVKVCLSLYISLLPMNHTLIHELANVYTVTIADIKRIILRAIEAPVKGMGMKSPELLKFVETCPKGAETLVTRLIHVLTDKADPSPELVSRVKDLYQKRVPDVRFLIPVLTGLSKKEVIAAIPKLIKLNPVVVKEVFHRLLGSHNLECTVAYSSPIMPADLLVSLHNIDPAKCDMKTIIKATNLCFQERNIYTQEVLAMVMQQLMEQPSIPTLFMRTVLQALAMYPRLIGLVLNILQRLIMKKVWEEPKIWEGFIRCCQKTKPQSFAVLMQLPPAQLSSVFQVTPELRQPLLDHIGSFTTHQRAHIPEAIMKTLEMTFPPGADPATEMDTLPLKSAAVHTIQTVTSTVQVLAEPQHPTDKEASKNDVKVVGKEKEVVGNNKTKNDAEKPQPGMEGKKRSHPSSISRERSRSPPSHSRGKSRSPKPREKGKSRSPSPSHTKVKSRSPSPSHTKVKSRSPSPSSGKGRRSSSPLASIGKSKSPSTSDKDNSKSLSPRDKGKSKSPSPSRDKGKSRTPSPTRGRRSGSEKSSPGSRGRGKSKQEKSAVVTPRRSTRSSKKHDS